MDCEEPYRATKLWNEVIRAFQSGMPLKKHRRKMHMYRDCFMATDAVTWLHCYLLNNHNFGPDVTRQQTVNLLGKFLKCHVIECVSLKSSKKCEFSDNSHLYRFTPISPQQFKTLPLHLLQSPACQRKVVAFKKSPKISKKYVPELQKENIPECLFIEKKMSLADLGLAWKTATIARLECLLPAIDLHEILDEKLISGHLVKHNVCRLSKTGVVSLIDKTEDIPHWVTSAMKCLANWPNARGSGSCLPNYPGFEKDVFKVVRDFFINPQVPLIPDYLSIAMVTVFMNLLHDQMQYIYDFKNCSSSIDPNLKHSPSVSSAAEVKTSTPTLSTDKERLDSRNRTLSGNSDGRLLLDDPEAMWDYPSMVLFETDFGTSDPVTKVVNNRSKLHSSYDNIHGSIESISTISICSVYHGANSFPDIPVNSGTPLKNWSSDSCLQEEKKDTLASQSLQLHRNMSVEYLSRKSHSMFDYLNIPDIDSEENLNESVCSSKTITEEDNKIAICNFEDVTNASSVLNQKMSSFVCSKSSPSSSSYGLNRTMRNNLKLFEEIVFPPELRSSFQLLLLFLNPPSRRQLHLLLRVINKILKNKKFILDIQMSMRDYLLQTFIPAIVQSDVNQNMLLGMVSFLLDNCEAVFQPPAGLKEQVEEICTLRNRKQYEEQKVSISTEALKGLLHSIIMDEKLAEKDRKRRIKQFKESHPDVYYEFFPVKHNLVRSRSAFLNRFASLRM